MSSVRKIQILGNIFRAYISFRYISIPVLRYLIQECFEKIVNKYFPNVYNIYDFFIFFIQLYSDITLFHKWRHLVVGASPGGGAKTYRCQDARYTCRQVGEGVGAL